MEEIVDELLGNLGQTEDEPVLIDDQIKQAALAGDGFSIVRLQDERRKADAQEFAGRCKEFQDRLNELKAERQTILRERDAYNDQLVLAAAELRRAQDAAHERSVEYNSLQLKLAFLDDRLLVLRDEHVEISEQLKQLLESRGGRN